MNWNSRLHTFIILHQFYQRQAVFSGSFHRKHYHSFQFCQRQAGKLFSVVVFTKNIVILFLFANSNSQNLHSQHFITLPFPKLPFPLPPKTNKYLKSFLLSALKIHLIGRESPTIKLKTATISSHSLPIPSHPIPHIFQTSLLLSSLTFWDFPATTTHFFLQF